MMGKSKVCVSSGEGFFLFLISVIFLSIFVYLSKSSFNMTRVGGVKMLRWGGFKNF